MLWHLSNKEASFVADDNGLGVEDKFALSVPQTMTIEAENEAGKRSQKFIFCDRIDSGEGLILCVVTEEIFREVRTVSPKLVGVNRKT